MLEDLPGAAGSNDAAGVRHSRMITHKVLLSDEVYGGIVAIEVAGHRFYRMLDALGIGAIGDHDIAFTAVHFI